MVKEDVRSEVQGSFSRRPIVPVSAYTGEGIEGCGCSSRKTPGGAAEKHLQALPHPGGLAPRWTVWAPSSPAPSSEGTVTEGTRS